MVPFVSFPNPCSLISSSRCLLSPSYSNPLPVHFSVLPKMVISFVSFASLPSLPPSLPSLLPSLPECRALQSSPALCAACLLRREKGAPRFIIFHKGEGGR